MRRRATRRQPQPPEAKGHHQDLPKREHRTLPTHVQTARPLTPLLRSAYRPACAYPRLARRFRRPPAYGIQHLRDDLDRFIFLLGGSDGEQFLTANNDGERRPNDH